MSDSIDEQRVPDVQCGNHLPHVAHATTAKAKRFDGTTTGIQTVEIPARCIGVRR